MAMTEPRPIDRADLAHRFGYHPPTDGQTVEDHGTVRGACLLLATRLVDLMPPGREASLAVTALEEAMMWANAAIARGRAARAANGR